MVRITLRQVRSEYTEYLNIDFIDISYKWSGILTDNENKKHAFSYVLDAVHGKTGSWYVLKKEIYLFNDVACKL